MKKRLFRALSTRNYRLFFTGQLISLVGTWMQIIGQGWLVLRLTGSGLAVGIVTALQFGPMLLAGVWGGLMADRLRKRRILLFTQSLFLVQAVTLGTLVAGGWVRVWMVYALAFAYGCVQVLDVPARQSFVSEMVADDDVMNAVGLNSAIFNGARMIGPAIAGILIAKVSIAFCFFANSGTFLAVLVALWLMREDELFVSHDRPTKGPGQIRAGLRYVASEPQLLLVIILMGVVSTLGLNFQIVLPVLARFTFHGNAATYGTMSSVMAAGSLLGAMYAATRLRPRQRLLVGSTIAFGAMELAAAFAPSLAAAYLLLPLVGLAGFLFISTANSTLQTVSSPQMRGRVMSLFSLVLLGSTPIGGPIVGWISETWSPRYGLGIGGAASLIAGIVVGAVLLRQRRRVRETAIVDQAPLVEPVPVSEAP
jgi:predicted MFS family arabinose efflux permease